MALPSGTITFLFSDIAGSTPLWEKMPHAMGRALETHDRILKEVIEKQHGHVFKTVGDAFHAVFERPQDALVAAIEAQERLASTDWGEIDRLLVRMALHTGTAELRDADYMGSAVNRVARVLALANPGQVLVSRAAADLLADTPTPDARLLDLGEFELRGMSRREKIFQLVHPALESEFPPLRPPAVTPTNLPPQLSTFIGRQAELQQVLSAIRKSRLVTLTGSGGSGKTRLAIESAAECMSSFQDGAWLAELAPLADGHLVVRAVASALGVREQPDRAELDTLCEELRTKKLLLILDNCEHLLDAVAQVAEAILRAAPDVHIVATSREAIGISGEIVLRIPSMALPSSDECEVTELEQFDATRLFLDRASAADLKFAATDSNCATIVQVCRRLDGIPLAIELAASRLRGMAVGELSAGLNDRFRILTGGSRTAVSRQRTLRALIDWSYDFLTDRERSLLRSLSVFSGGWTLPAAKAVGATRDVSGSDVFDLLSALVEKSLVSIEPQPNGTGRYRLLETIRQYGADKLAEAGEAEAARDRHLEFFGALLDRRASKSRDPLQKIATENLSQPAGESDAMSEDELNEQLSTDWENVRAAVEWALATDVPTGLRLAAGLTGFYERQTRIVEGSEILEKAIKASEYLGDTFDRLMAYTCAARIVFRKAETALALSYARKAEEIARSVGQPVGIAVAKGIIGNVLANEGDFEGARQAYIEVGVIAEQIGNLLLRARSTYGQMLLEREQGNFPEFRRLLDKCETQFAEANLAMWVSWTRSYRGSYAEETGDLPTAARFYAEVMNEMKGVEGNVGAFWHWECLARLASRVGKPESTAMLFGASERFRKKMGWPVQPNEAHRNERAKVAALQSLGNAYDEHFTAGRALTYEEVNELALRTAAAIIEGGEAVEK